MSGRLLIERPQPAAAHALAKSRPIYSNIAIAIRHVIDEGYGEQKLWLEILE